MQILCLNTVISCLIGVLLTAQTCLSPEPAFVLFMFHRVGSFLLDWRSTKYQEQNVYTKLLNNLSNTTALLYTK